MDSSVEIPQNGTRANNVHNVAWSFRRKPAYLKKPFEQETAGLNDLGRGADALTSDGSSCLATLSLDGEFADGESQKSQSSSSSDPRPLSVIVQIMETLISNMFTTVSSLKNAYVQLQSAHAPYDADKLQVADEAVIAELRRLSELKRSYRDRLATVTAEHVQEDAAFKPQQSTLKSYEGIINNFHTEIQKKNAMVENLKDTLARTTLKKEKLERRVKRLEQRLARDSLFNAPSDVSPTPQLLESAVLGASEAARSFTKLLMSLMQTAEWDLDAAANSIHSGINYVRGTHKKFAFESYVCQRMLNGFENESFYVSGSIPSVLDPEKKRQECFHEFQGLRSADPTEVVNTNPKSMFGRYCLKKFVDLIHPKMEEMFFGNLEQRKQVLNDNHPHSQFYQNFLKLAKAMWLLQRLAFSFEPSARIFQVKQNAEFLPLYMESIVQMVELEASTPGIRPRVGFTVVPGFRVEKTIIKCQVYITAEASNESVQVQ